MSTVRIICTVCGYINPTSTVTIIPIVLVVPCQDPLRNSTILSSDVPVSAIQWFWIPYITPIGCFVYLYQLKQKHGACEKA